MKVSIRQALADKNRAALEALLAEDPDLRPDDERELFDFGNQLTRLGFIDVLESVASRFLTHAPESLLAQQFLLTAMVQLDRFEPGRPVAEEILRRDPTNLTALSSLGVIEQVGGDVEKAITLYKQALAIDPANGLASKNLSYLLTAHGRTRERAEYDGGLIDWRSSLFLDRPRYQLSTNPAVVEAAKTVLKDGLCVLRGVIRPDFTQRMRQAFFEAGAAEQLATAIGVEGFQSAQLDQACQFLGEAFAMEAVITDPLWEILIEVFGQEPVLNPQQTVLRLVVSDADASHVPFHQDMRAFGRIGLNVWAPMTPAGGDHPGLELIPKRIAKLLPTMATPGDYDYLNIDIEASAEELDLATAVTPELSPGDCILFLGDVAHRSYIPPSLKASGPSQRLSIEMRFFAS